MNQGPGSQLFSHTLGALTPTPSLSQLVETRMRRSSPTAWSIKLSPGSTTPPGTDPMAVGAKVLDLLDEMQGDGRPLILIVDDLQWADRPSSRAVLFALRRLRVDKVLTVLAARSGELDDPGWARFTGGDARVTRIRLAGLTPNEIIEMAGELAIGALSRHGATRLATHTQGNALYCRALLEEIGVAGLNAAGDRGLPAPRELSAVILSRVAAMPASTQEFLSAASVWGQHAPVSAILSVARLADGQAEVDAVVAAGLMSESELMSELTFTHPLYRAAIYGDLSPTTRRELHMGASQIVSGRAQLVHRVSASMGCDESLATELEESARASSLAGDSGASAWAFEQAAALSDTPGDKTRRLLDAAVVHLESADTPAATRVLTSCESASARHDALTGLLAVFGGTPIAENRLLAAWQAHDPRIEPEIGARAATSLTNWMVMSGRPDEALAWAERAVESSVSNSALRAMARTAQAYAFGAGGRSSEGLAVLGFLPESGNAVPMSETDALIMRGILEVYTDDLSGAVADLGIASTRMRTGLPTSYPGPCLSHLSDAHFRRGDWDAALTHAQLATSSAEDVDRPVDLARAHARMAQVLAFRGEWSSAQAHVASARSAADRAPLLLAVAAAAVAGASLASARGDQLGVISSTEAVRATGLLGVGGRPGIFNWRAIEADALVGLGRLDEADIALDEFEAAIPVSGLASAEMMLLRCRGNLAVAREHSTGAEEAFTRAHSLEELVSMPFERALVNLHDGRRLNVVGNQPAAVAQFEKAHRILSELGADPYIEVCASELAALQVTASTESPAALLGLSRAELAVARLVATGLTNREVATQLFVSVKTVEYHLRNTYIKLDITSRRALTGLLT